MLKDASVSAEPSSFVVGAVQDRSAVPFGACTVTVTGTLVMPPGPVQRNLKVLSCVNGPTVSLPESGFAPVQSPRPSQDVASLVDQVKVVNPFIGTVVGFAASVTVGNGAGATDTVTDWLALPPALSQVKMNVLVLVSELRVWLPDVGLLPDQAPDAVHDVAFVEDQLRVEEPL